MLGSKQPSKGGWRRWLKKSNQVGWWLFIASDRTDQPRYQRNERVQQNLKKRS